MQFLESMLSDFDARGGGAAAGPAGPLDLPSDAFDLPDAWGAQQHGGLRPTPFDQQLQLQQQQQMLIHQRAVEAYGHRESTSTAYSGFVPLGVSASAPVAMAAPAHSGMSGSMGSMNLGPSVRSHSAYPGQMAAAPPGPDPRLQLQLLALQQQQQQQQRAIAAAVAAAAQPGVRGPAAPQPAQPRATPRRQSHAYADFDYEEPEVSLQTSKSGRVRKVRDRSDGWGMWLGAPACLPTHPLNQPTN